MFISADPSGIKDISYSVKQAKLTVSRHKRCLCTSCEAQKGLAAAECSLRIYLCERTDLKWNDHTDVVCSNDDRDSSWEVSLMKNRHVRFLCYFH